MLKLPQNIKVKGLIIFCNKCKIRVAGKCGATGKSIRSCKDTDRHRYKIIVHIPYSSCVKTKLLETRDPSLAIQEAMNFRKAMEAYEYSPRVCTTKTTTPKTITEGMVYYLCYLNNETPFEQEHKIRSSAHKKEVERYFGYFADYLIEQGIHPESMPIEKLNRDVVGKLKSYLLETKKFAPRTYNKYIGLMRIFISYLIDEFDLKIKNPFKNFKPLPTKTKIETIGNNEFHALLNIISPLNGTEILKNNQRKNRYKPWLKDAFMLALLTGRRREEFVHLKFNGIKENEQGEPVSIKIPDFKVNRSKGITIQEEIKWIHIPIIAPLKKLLYDLGYNKYKGKNIYILAPNETMKRKTIMDFISKSFTFYYKQLNTGRDLTLYDLRKTYISHLYANHGSDARLITGHEGENVMRNHYIDERVLAEVAESFEIFGL